MKTFISVCALIFASAVLIQPALAADNENAVWGIVSTSDRIRRDEADTRWRYGIASQWRNFHRGSGSDQYLLRTSIGLDLKPGMTAWAGFDYFVTDPSGGGTRYERRLWQQLAWAAKSYDWGSLSFRSRFEQRDIENGSDIGLRFRQQAQLAIPVDSRDATAIFSVEHFSNLKDTDWGARSGFDQIRSYGGIRIPMTDSTSVEAGYMHQYVNRAGGNDAVNHTLMLHLRVRLP